MHGLRKAPVKVGIAVVAVLILAAIPCIVPVWASFNAQRGATSFEQIQTGSTTVEITPQSLESSGKRFGINLGDQTFYGSGQLLKNLVFRNPGFEGLEYRSIIKCSNARGHTCDDANSHASWAASFWQDATYTFQTGANRGKTGALVAFTTGPARYTFSSGLYPNSGDYFLLDKYFPGDPTAGWWTSAQGGASFAAEFHDLSPHSQGKQALRIDASQPGASANLTSYFDTYADGHPKESPARSFLRMHGAYEIRFRAKPIAGAAELNITMDRSGSPSFLNKRIALNPGWQDYVVPFRAEDDAANTHALELQFTIAHASVLLDDVSLTSTGDDARNTTAFRDDVVKALEEFHPGILRLMASSTQLGSSIPNLLAAPMARVRSGYSAWNQKQEDIPIGIPEFLALCARIGAEPWIVLPTATTPADAQTLITYFTRASATGQKPWTEQFPRIHLELGNETWNSGFAGETMEDSAAYGQHADDVFRALRATPGFQASRFDLVVGGQAEWPQRNQSILAAAGSSYDSLAIAPYIVRTLNDPPGNGTPGNDTLFGPVMAEPELTDRSGVVRESSQFARTAGHPAALAVYEVNLHTTGGNAAQSTLDRVTPSLAGGLSVASHMLQMRRDDAVHDQMLFCLPQFSYQRDDGKYILLWGSTVDMGPTQRRRPDFLFLALANQVADGTLLKTIQTGDDPTWLARDSAGSTAGSVRVVQSFAFDLRTSHERALLVLNLGPKPQKVRVADGTLAARQVKMQTLAGVPDADNENSEQVRVSRESLAAGRSPFEIVVPSYGMTLLRWQID
jgi:hypothetical protein